MNTRPICLVSQLGCIPAWHAGVPAALWSHPHCPPQWKRVAYLAGRLYPCRRLWRAALLSCPLALSVSRRALSLGRPTPRLYPRRAWHQRSHGPSHRGPGGSASPHERAAFSGPSGGPKQVLLEGTQKQAHINGALLCLREVRAVCSRHTRPCGAAPSPTTGRDRCSINTCHIACVGITRPSGHHCSSVGPTKNDESGPQPDQEGVK